MNDRLTPPMLRDLAALPWGYTQERFRKWCEEEAARREAEAKELGRNTDGASQGPAVPQGEREGPGGAAIFGTGVSRTISEPSPPSFIREDKPAPAADDLAHSLRSVTTVDHRWDAHALSIIRRYENDRHRAADAIDAATAEASSCAAAYKASEARVRELEHDKSWPGLQAALAAEKARADRMAAEIERAKVMIGARLDDMSAVQRGAEVNAAWHVLNNALASEGGDRG